jgi:1-hydroxycarotenoid 3,4-desaturase
VSATTSTTILEISHLRIRGCEETSVDRIEFRADCRCHSPVQKIISPKSTILLDVQFNVSNNLDTILWTCTALCVNGRGKDLASVPNARRKDKVVIIGAGVGGLVAAVELAHHGLDVTVVDQAEAPGGKMRQIIIGDARVDAGPTVFTMRWVFDELFHAVGTSLEAQLTITKAERLARHAWSEDERLDLFADQAQSVDAIATFAGRAEADRYRAFCSEAKRIYQVLEGPFIKSAKTNPFGLIGRIGVTGLSDIWRIQPFVSLWRELGRHFHDPRLRQLFGRYATYCGSSPFLAPATLMLVAHVEQEGVWLVEGGMHQVAVSLAKLATSKGATFHYGTAVDRIWAGADGRVNGVTLADGRVIEADCVVSNGDVSALGAGLLGADVRRAAAPVARAARSLSAITWATNAETSGFPLLRHTVFFGRDYAAEFDDIFKQGATPSDPTVYVCAQDRNAADGGVHEGQERLLCLINAPASGDERSDPSWELERCQTQAFRVLERCGLKIHASPDQMVATSPTGFHRLFPASGGALYGRASHGWSSSFQRAGSRTKVPGLYLAGGSVHPGPGVPMAALSGRLAAHSVLTDLASTRQLRAVATVGGTSMR